MVKINIDNLKIADSLQKKANNCLATNTENFETKDFKFVFEDNSNSIYNDKSIKDQFMTKQNNKCCYCERKLIGSIEFDMEHYRPKGGWVQDNEKLNKPGYYWLAHDWDNLLLSCKVFNNAKLNKFKLANPKERAFNHNFDIKAAEKPLLINPRNEDPSQFITFVDEVPKSKNKDPKGTYTISTLKLDSVNLNEVRMSKLKALKTLFKTYDLIPEELDVKYKKPIQNLVLAYKNEVSNQKGEFILMFDCYFNSIKHKYDFL
jgi:uncharacterized protein (TIGR02646 family)